MDNMIGLVAVIMAFGIPLGAFYTYYHVRKLRSQERLAALARGAEIPMVPELSPGASSRRWGILLVCGSIGYILAMVSLARLGDTDAMQAAALGILPFAIGIGFFIDWTLIRRDLRASS
jgi:hypothetical protein